MDANQRSEINNQTNNGANEKWTPGSRGASADSNKPLDHTYPQGEVDQGNQQRDIMGTPQGAAAVGDRCSGEDAGIPGGSMENQINGGSGTVQGITDSHQRQMEQKSGAYGLLEQPVGHRDKHGGVNVAGNRQSTQGGGMAGPQGGSQSVQSGSMGNRQSGAPASTQGAGMPGPGAHAGSSAGNLGGQEAQRGNTQLDVSGSRSMSNQHSDAGGVHQSNDMTGGLPRSPGNTGANNALSSDRTGSQTGPDVHESNDASGGYPRSPGYANKLKGDQNMDDDTGFKRKP